MNFLVTWSSSIYRSGPCVLRNNLQLNSDKTCEIVLDSRRRRWHAAEPAPLPGIVCSRSLMLGMVIADNFTVTQHVQRLMTSSAQTNYELRVLRSMHCHGLNNAALQYVHHQLNKHILPECTYILCIDIVTLLYKPNSCNYASTAVHRCHGLVSVAQY